MTEETRYFQKSIDRDQRLFNYLSDNGFISLDSDRAEIRHIISGELAASEKRIMELEESAKHDADIDMVLAPFPVRDKILMSFREAWANRVSGAEPPDYTLSRVLDDLKIK